MPDAYPLLRSEIDAAPAERDGESYYILYDRAGIAGSRLLVSPLALLVAGRLDGASSVLDIADALSREFGEPIAGGDVEQIVQALDDAFFLCGARFQDFQAQVARDFRAGPVRASGLAGSAYDDDPLRLAEELDRMIAEAPPPEEPAPPGTSFPRGIIVPHIDFQRGGAGYGQAYRYLSRVEAPRTVVVIGTAHTPLHERFSLCEKDFDTPFGRVPVDRELCARVRTALGPHSDVDWDLLAHRGEHSIELQAVWLRHVFGESIRIVPLLAASVGEFIDGEQAPDDAERDPVFRKLAACLAAAVEEGDVMLMASADLSHIGPGFGDAREVTNQFLAEVEEADRDYLEAVAVNPVAGLESLAAHGDRHHVCGSACVFITGLALPGSGARLLGYHQAVTPEMRQAVTFAAMALD